jgi:hypothetical protein
MTTSQLVHKHGGTHHSHGVFQGGAAMNMFYKMIPRPSYRYSTQLQNTKSLEKIESHLHSNMKDTLILKFNGKLETRSSSTPISDSSRTETDKEEFLSDVQDMVEHYGLQSFFYLPGPDSAMHNLATEPHSFTLSSVLAEHKARNIPELSPVYDANQDELPSSILARFKCYDEFELDNINLSRLVIDLLISVELRQKVKTRFNHYSDFAYLPGQVYFMMVLEVCNVSFTFDIDAARSSLQDIKLVNYAGENVSDFADEALCLIKVLHGGYALPYQLGSTLLRKVCETQSTYFNRNMYMHYDKALAMEREHGPHKDPKLLERHPSYTEYGPVGVCNIMQREYGLLVQLKDWPALCPTVPEGNYTPSNPGERNPHGMRCRRCNSEFHFARECPENSEGGDKENNLGHKVAQDTKGNTDRSGNGSNESHGMRNGLPFIQWKYIRPSDENDSFVLNGTRFYYCGKCVCTRTRKVGFYNLTHTTGNHVSGLSKRSRQSEGNKDNGGTNADDSSRGRNTSNTGDRLSASLSSVDDGRTSNESTESDPVDTDPGGLEFQGAFLAALTHDDGAWMAKVEDADVEGPSAVGTSTLDLWDDESVGDGSGFDEDSPQSPDGIHVTTLVQEIDIVTNNQTSRHLTIEELDALLNIAASKPRNPFWPENVVVSAHGYTKFDEGTHYTLLPNNRFTSGDVYFCDRCDAKGPYLKQCSQCILGRHCKIDEEGTNVYDPEFVHYDTGTGDEWRVGQVNTSEDNNSNIPFDAYSINSSSTSSHTPSMSSLLPAVSPTSSLTTTSLFTFFYASICPLLHGPDVIYSVIFHFILHIGDSFSAGTQVLYSSLLFFSMLIWDTITLYQGSSSTIISRCSHRYRAKHNIHLRGYPSSWMMLSFFMFFSAQGLRHPLPSALHNIHGTFHRAIKVSNLVDLSPSILLDYHHLRYDDCFQCAVASDSIPSPHLAIPLELEGEVGINRGLHLAASGALEESVVSVMEEPQFFTPFTSLTTLRAHCDSIDYMDCTLLDRSLIQDTDLFGFSDLCPEVVHIAHNDESTPVGGAECNLLSEAAYNAAVLGKVDLLPLHPSSSSSFPVIFDSGASLAISPSLSDFAGPIERYTVDKQLGGMANGMRIEGIGNIQWSFRTSDKLLVVHSRCYYVPQSKARLISPQRLFNKAKGVEGTFTVLEEHALISVNSTLL